MRLFSGLMTAALALAGATQAAAVNVSYYSSFSDTGTGITFSGTPFFTESLPDINVDFSTGNGPTGRPGSGQIFGADFTGTISAPTAGTYSFTLGSDDAGYLYIDGLAIGGLGGSHGYQSATYMATLTAGTHALEVQYDNTACCGAAVGLTQNGTSFTSAVPEPTIWTLLIGGFGLAGLKLRSGRREDRTRAMT